MDITQVFETLARSQPNAPAMHVPGRTSLSYADLGAQIRYVRERLRSWGIQPGDIVGAALPSRPEMAVAIATLPSSCTFAPLDPSLPSDAYALLLARIEPKAVLVPRGDEHAIRAAARRLGIAEIDVTPEQGAGAGLFTLDLGRGGSTLGACRPVDPRLAYVLTSSGTTGRRKLVPAEHGAMLCHARAVCDWLDFTPDDVGVHITPMYFGSGLRFGLISALLAGRSIVCLPHADIEALFASIEQFRPTFLAAGFSVFQAILRRASEFRAAVAQNRFRFMLSGSGRLDPDDADRLEQLFGAPMLTGLSSTETCRIALDPLPPRLRKRGSVGLPLVNEVGILDGAGDIRSNGGPGEIVVRGPMVFRAYLDDPELNAASFVGEWFRTGDLGRIDQDGYVFVEGRIKEIINRGGEKISPVEIDLAIESLPGIKEAAAFGVPHPTLGEELVAAVVREENAGIDEALVVERVRARAGARGAPRRVYFVERLPRTANGKLRRSALAELVSQDQRVAARSPASGAARVGPWSPLEGALAGLWSSLLPAVTIGRDDDFFLLGGDSLRGMELLAHVEELFGVDLPIELLFGEATTVARMARAIEAARSRTEVQKSIARRPERRAAYLSDTQRRMWFLARLNPGDPTYNESRAYRLMGDVDVEALQRSVRYVARRHEILRTTYSLVDDEPRQIVREDLAIELDCNDLGALPATQQRQAMQHLLLGEIQRAFDLEAGPPLRMLLVRLGEREHVLLRVIHHIASDGWSTGIFERELSAAYAAFAKGRPPELPPLPIQYADYAAWQCEQQQGEVLEAQLGYWKKQLADIGTLELPTDRPRPLVATHEGAHLAFELPATLTTALKALGQREGATLFMTLLAAFQVLLHRYSGQEDIAVGSPIAGRRRTELEGLIGFFANTLVLRSDLSGNPGFRELLGRVREAALAAYAHQDLPFEKLVEELAPAREMSRNPLFQVGFHLRNAPGAALALDGVDVRRLALEGESAKFDLTVSMRESPAGLHASWEYATDLYDAATIERMARHFECVLEAIVADPEQDIGQLPLLPEADRHQLLVEWNDTATDSSDRGIHQLFEVQAARTPAAVAVVCGDRQLTYSELNARANQVAHQLIALGVGPEVLVGLCLQRSLDLIIGLFGILKAGGVYVPLDPGYPAARLAFMLKETRAPVLLTQQGLLELLPPFEGRILCLDRDWAEIHAHSQANPSPAVTAQSLAYVIYTSGSTGEPKGILLPHATLGNLMAWHGAGTPGGRVAQFTSIGFDVSLQEILYALLSGKVLVVVDDDTRLQPDSLAIFIQDHAITDLFVPNLVLEYLARAVVHAKRHLPALANVYQAGEALTISPVVQAFFDNHPTCRLHNHYGPAESHVVTAETLPANPTEWPFRPAIGSPISNTRIYILDGHGEPAPIGVTGELYVAGAGVARGYLNRPALTAEKFLVDRFSKVPGARMYRTGDRARYLSDGRIEFLGRLDDQVKIRGFRIELGEIEAVLAEHPAVGQAVVLAREDTPSDKRLVAYVVPTDPSVADLEALRAVVRERLPDYMRPAAYVRLERLPLTPNGKIDRQALPAPSGGDAAGDTFVPPRHALEELIAEVWRDLLKLTRVGVHDNFFELGGHSLLAAQLLARLTTLLQIDLPLRGFFATPTVSALAATAEQRLGAGEAREASRILSTPVTGGLPLSFAQERLWFINQLLPDEAAYNMPTAWRLRGPLDVLALQRSLDAVVARHETLRTRFGLRDGEPVQVIDPPQGVALLLTDVSAMPHAEREAHARKIADTEAWQPFDLEAGPLLRAQLLRLADDEHLLLLTVHHIASDGWSVGIFARELSAAYAAFTKGRQPQWPALPIQYADYAVWQREWLQGDVLETQLGYWRNQLADIGTLELPTDRPRPPIASYQGAHLTFNVPAPLTGKLKALGRREGATLFMTLLAAFQVLLCRYSGQEDIAVGAPIAGRRRTELEGLIGFFANTLVLRSDLSGNPGFRELLARVRETTLSAYTHQDLPFEKLVEELAPARDLSRNPLFQVLFVLQNAPGARRALEGLEVSLLQLERRSAKFDLSVSVSESPAGLHASWEYATDLYDAATIERMARQFECVLEAIVADPEQGIGQLALLPEVERRRLLVEWNDAAADYPRDRGVHQLFEAQAARTPATVAVVCDDRQLTYAELNGRANQLAHQLIALGVGPDVLVGLCLERSLDLIVGVLGILKAGGAYVPLDPGYPAARLAFMLKETHAPVLLTQQGLLESLPPFDGRILCLDRDWPAISAHRQANPPPAVTAQSLAYVIYTSGSTGEPKGILLPHATLVNLMAWHTRGSSGGRVAQLTSISFDVSVQEILYALLSGKTLVIVDDDTRLQPEKLAAFIQDHAITDLFVPNIVLEYFAHAVVQAKRHLPALAHVYQAGEALTITPAVQAFFEHHPTCRLHNHYGPAESHVVTAETLPANVTLWPYRPSIGSPISNTRIYILDGHGKPAPIGVTGELYVAGAGVARGYLNRPELTAQKFLPDPFSAVPGARMYRTGDRARYCPDGRIEFLGRLDHQVKIRGFRIELGEIETVLAEHPAVRQAVVLAREDRPGDTRLVAYVVSADASLVGAEPLRTFLRERLPEYMRPVTYVLLQHLPLTPNGKIDRKALPPPDVSRAHAGQAYQLPRTPNEEALARIWVEVLKITEIGIHDNFFDLGGHSLLAVQVVSRIRRQLDLEIPLRSIFEHQTIETLAIVLLEKQVEADGVEGMEQRLVELEALTEEAAVNQLFKEENAFQCTSSRSAWFGRRPCNLLILINEDFDWDSFERLARRVREVDPLINAVVLRDHPGTMPDLPAYPTLTFSPAVVRHPLAAHGKVFCGYPMSKSEEYRAMEKTGICVPKWVLLKDGAVPDLSGFDEYVVRKPDYGGHGAEVKVVRRGRVRWKPITTRAAGTSSSTIIQELIHTGPQLVSYRVNTLFGKVLYSVRHERTTKSEMRAGANEEHPAPGWGSIVASARGSRVSLNFDDEVLRLGEAAAGAFPEVPLLGFDIVRQEPSGRLYVLEANAIGYVWTFRSSQVADYGFSLEEQFDGMRKAAYILAEKTQEHAC